MQQTVTTEGRARMEEQKRQALARRQAVADGTRPQQSHVSVKTTWVAPRGSRQTKVPTAWLLVLPEDVLLSTLGWIVDFSDCAAFCLASPRLGLLALRGDVVRFKDPLFAVAMELLVGARALNGLFTIGLSKALLRKYAADERASGANLPWLRNVSPTQCFRTVTNTINKCRFEDWWMSSPDESLESLVRTEKVVNNHYKVVLHFEGAAGMERKVRKVSWHGNVLHKDISFEGGKNHERMTRCLFPDGSVQYYEGEKGHERLTRLTAPRGLIYCYEGEKGHERRTHATTPRGLIYCFEGEKGHERRTRLTTPRGRVYYYKGEKGHERRKRVRRRNVDLSS